MRRREFVAGVCGVAATWPLVARAQQPPAPMVGYLASSTPVSSFVTAFQRGLSEFGYVEGANLTVEYRSAEGQFDRLPALAAELVQRQVAAIVASDGTLGLPTPGLGRTENGTGGTWRGAPAPLGGSLGRIRVNYELALPASTVTRGNPISREP